MWLGLVGGLLVLTFWVAIIGAPYVPTKRRDIAAVFDLVELGEGERLVDLGSGDGRLLLAAAQRDRLATGFELSLPLYLMSRWRLRRYSDLVDVRWNNFWKQPLPDDTAVVFSFLATKFMPKLKKYLIAETNRLRRPILFVSYGFTVDGMEPIKTDRALLVYRFEPHS